MTIVPFYNYRAKVLRIIDADTYIMAVDLGLDHRAKKRLRLMANSGPIDCPERNTIEGRTAMRYVEDMLPLRQWVHIFTVPDTREVTDKADSFGRYLARVKTEFIPDLGDRLLELGLALAWKP